jgi:RimJ/RimL family protein N-acetyltransferase
VRVQAITGVDNFASHRVLEKAGFTKEGIIRKSAFIRGEWKDGVLYSVKEPVELTAFDHATRK